MKKIAVLHRYPPKQVIGTNASFVPFLETLISRGFEVFYVTYKDGKFPFELAGLNFVYIPFSFERGNTLDLFVKTVLWIFLVPFYVLYLQIKYKLDIVYCDDSVPYYGFLSKLISPFSKVVIRLGDLQMGYFVADINIRLFNLFLKMEVAMWRKLDGLIPISQRFKDYIISNTVDASKIKVVEESINLDNDGVSFEKKSHKKVVFLFHGTLVSCKGLDVLIKAFHKFSQNKPDVELVIAGGGYAERKIRNLVRKLRLGNVVFTGWYNLEQLEEIMQGVDISVVMRSPNLANNFVVTTCLLENWKYKIPVIVPDLYSFRNVIKDGENGVLFKAGDVNDLADRMNYLYNNKNLWKNLGEKGYKTAREKFYYKDIAQKMVTCIEGFL